MTQSQRNPQLWTPSKLALGPASGLRALDGLSLSYRQRLAAPGRCSLLALRSRQQHPRPASPAGPPASPAGPQRCPRPPQRAERRATARARACPCSLTPTTRRRAACTWTTTASSRPSPLSSRWARRSRSKGTRQDLSWFLFCSVLYPAKGYEGMLALKGDVGTPWQGSSSGQSALLPDLFRLHQHAA